MSPRMITTFGALVLGVTSVGSWASELPAAAAPTAPAAPSADCNPVNGAQCPGAGAGRPGRTITVTLPAGSVSGGGGGPECPDTTGPGQWETWESWGEPRGLDPPPEGEKGPGDTTYWYFICIDMNGRLGAPVQFPAQQGWGGPNPPATPPTAADVLPALWAEVQGMLLPPTINLQPGPTTPTGAPYTAKVNTPTFVSITNPQPTTRYETTYQGIYVYIDVTPTVTLHSGETGAAAVPCDDDGTAYDPQGPEPRQQAQATGACAYIYKLRTGTEARPPAWTGDVTITWLAMWNSNQAGQNGGPLPTAPSVTQFQRTVGELQGVVTKAGG